MPASARRLTLIALTAAVLQLTACGGGPKVTSGPGADPSAARGLLVAAAADGLVPLEVDSVPSVFKGGVAEVARIAEQSTSWLGVRFAPTPYGAGSLRKRVVLRFEGAGDTAAMTCAGTAPRGSLPSPPIQVRAFFCDGLRAVADTAATATGTESADADRAITAVLDRLFPGRGGESYSGFPGVSLGVGIGSGGGFGLGGGLHF